MSVELPLRTRVASPRNRLATVVVVRDHFAFRRERIGLEFFDRLVSVSVAPIRRRLAKEQHVLRHATSHPRSVFALLGPAKPIRLVVLANNVRDDRFHAEKREAMPLVMCDRFRMKRVERLKSEARQATWYDPVFDVATEHSAGLHHAE